MRVSERLTFLVRAFEEAGRVPIEILVSHDVFYALEEEVGPQCNVLCGTTVGGGMPCIEMDGVQIVPWYGLKGSDIRVIFEYDLL